MMYKSQIRVMTKTVIHMWLLNSSHQAVLRLHQFIDISDFQYEQQTFVRGMTLVVPYEPRHEKPCFSYMRITKAQISLRIRAVWSAPLLFAA